MCKLQLPLLQHRTIIYPESSIQETIWKGHAATESPQIQRDTNAYNGYWYMKAISCEGTKGITNHESNTLYHKQKREVGNLGQY